MIHDCIDYKQCCNVAGGKEYEVDKSLDIDFHGFHWLSLFPLTIHVLTKNHISS